MHASTARATTTESEQLALFGPQGAGVGGGPEPPDAEAVDLANAAMVCAALGLGIYIDSFV
jgi:hypothetical protein